MNIFGWSCNCSSNEAPHRIYIENDREIMEVVTDGIEMALTLQVPTPEPALSHADFRTTVAHVREQIGAPDHSDDSDSDDSDDSNGSKSGPHALPVKKLWDIFRGALNA
jgi:hypothetical protein